MFGPSHYQADGVCGVISGGSLLCLEVRLGLGVLIVALLMYECVLISNLSANSLKHPPKPSITCS